LLELSSKLICETNVPVCHLQRQIFLLNIPEIMDGTRAEDADDGDVPAVTEETGLLAASAENGASTTSTSPASSSAGGESSQAAAVLWEELDRPWPSTFERSISILASPIIPTKQADLFTKSPKPGSTPLALAKRRNLDRGVHTPERGAFQNLKFGRSDSISDRPMSKKVLSLDFLKNQVDIEAMNKKAAKRTAKAQKYRQKILQEKGAQPAKTKSGTGRAEDIAGANKNGGKATFAQCAFNLANILMGVGLLGLPFVFKSAGWYGGIFCILSFGFITWKTSIFIGRELNGDPRPSHYFNDSPFKSPLRPGMSSAARMLPPISSFPDIARAAFGNWGCYVLSFVLYFELFSCISIFFVSMGDHLHQLFPSISMTTHMCLVSAASMVPTIILRTPALLSYLSMVGTFATIAVVLSVIASAFLEGDIAEKVAEKEGIEDSEPYHIAWRSEGLALAFGLVAYCFSGHAIVPSIYTSMERPQDFEKMVTLTFVLVIGCCLAVAISGYYVFGSTVQDQITLSLERSSQAVLAMKALTWLMVLTGEFIHKR
jgi:solute carrier family 32 (vesicular inhibitory amino acid transporter)